MFLWCLNISLAFDFVFTDYKKKMIKEMESRYSDDYVIMLIPLWEVVILYIDEGYQSDYITIAHTCIA
jgi:hypothetical protein